MQPDHASRSGGKRMSGILPRGTVDRPLLTVVTAVFNAASTLEATIQSVLCQTYPHIEYIIIDGGSTDGTLDIIRKYDDAIDYWMSGPDKGVYDAMNKGIKASSGSWLNFLNANDVFSDRTTIEYVATRYLQSDARFIYSDVLLKNGKQTPQRYVCDHQRLIVNHQSSIYQKSLHSEHGFYLVAPALTISDYLFFSLIDKNDYLKADRPIAIYDTTGVSQSQKSVEQKLIVDYLINGMPKFKFVSYFQLYYYYRSLKRYFGRF
jgi:glycosyltransferase involved in cell wall biosynthesis